MKEQSLFVLFPAKHVLLFIWLVLHTREFGFFYTLLRVPFLSLGSRPRKGTPLYCDWSKYINTAERGPFRNISLTFQMLVHTSHPSNGTNHGVVNKDFTVKVWLFHRPLGGTGVTWAFTIIGPLKAKKQSSQEAAACFYWKEIMIATEQWSNVGSHSTESAKLQITLSCNVLSVDVGRVSTIHQQETRISCQHTGQPLNLKPVQGEAEEVTEKHDNHVFPQWKLQLRCFYLCQVCYCGVFTESGFYTQICPLVHWGDLMGHD